MFFFLLKIKHLHIWFIISLAIFAQTRGKGDRGGYPPPPPPPVRTLTNNFMYFIQPVTRLVYYYNIICNASSKNWLSFNWNCQNQILFLVGIGWWCHYTDMTIDCVDMFINVFHDGWPYNEGIHCTCKWMNVS